MVLLITCTHVCSSNKSNDRGEGKLTIIHYLHSVVFCLTILLGVTNNMIMVIMQSNC